MLVFGGSTGKLTCPYNKRAIAAQFAFAPFYGFFKQRCLDGILTGIRYKKTQFLHPDNRIPRSVFIHHFSPRIGRRNYVCSDA
jgi:hypothetical protein